MQILKTNQTDTAMNFDLQGRIDTVTAPEVEAVLNEVPASVKEVVLSFKELDYISSAGLRVLLSAHKKMRGQGGSLVITDANEVIQEIFEVTGFSDILNIQ